jgi:hypothetical protein
MKMSHRRLERLRRQAYEARIRGNSKMDEHQLLAALERAGRGSAVQPLWTSWFARRGVTP